MYFRSHPKLARSETQSFPETSLIKLEFIKLESAPNTIICGEIHRCSETHLLSFVCTVCRADFTDFTAYSSHLNYHFGGIPIEIVETIEENKVSVSNDLPKAKVAPKIKRKATAKLTPSTNVLPEKSNRLTSQHNLSLINDQLRKPVRSSKIKKEQKTTDAKLLESNNAPPLLALTMATDSYTSSVDFSSCKLCTQEFETLVEYELHIKKENTENNMLKCPYVVSGKSQDNTRCRLKALYSSNCELTKHLRVGHGQNVKILKCDICNKSFKSPLGLQCHKTIHTGERPYQCDICKKSFPLYNYLKTHMRFHTGEKPELCTKCGQGFATKSTLSLHMRRHNGDHKRQKCSVCGQGFLYPSQLTVHMRVHTGEKPFSCKLCGKRYRSKCLVQQHEMFHNLEKKHPCRFCDQMFKQSSNRNLHERQKHNVAKT